MKFGTILVDPPWAYQKTTRHESLSGYSDVEYDPLSTTDLCALPVGDLATWNAVLLLWTTWPFLPDAISICKAWGFKYVTGLPWVKTQASDPSALKYGVGYWFRGATEPIVVGKRGSAFRTNYVGFLGPGLRHSRKPESIYQIAEAFPGPRLEIFAREHDDVSWDLTGWYQLGNELKHDGGDIRETLPRLVGSPSEWEHYRVGVQREDHL